MEPIYSDVDLLLDALRRALREMPATSPNRAVLTAALQCVECGHSNCSEIGTRDSEIAGLDLAARHLSSLQCMLALGEERRALHVAMRAMEGALMSACVR